MYRSDLNPRDRSGAIIGVALIHAALLIAFLNLSGKMPLPASETITQLLNINQPKPPPPPPQQKVQPRPKEKSGGAAPPNIRSQATPVVAPRPKIVTPPQPRIAATQAPRQGTASTQGASSLPGPGTGAGGVGTGTGSGAGGTGPGGGGEGIAVPVHLVRGISGRDYPLAIMARWPPGGRIDVILRVEADGRISSCRVGRSFGDALADQWTCALITQRGQFRPAIDRSGRPVAGWFGYSQAE